MYCTFGFNCHLQIWLFSDSFNSVMWKQLKKAAGTMQPLFWVSFLPARKVDVTDLPICFVWGFLPYVLYGSYPPVLVLPTDSHFMGPGPQLWTATTSVPLGCCQFWAQIWKQRRILGLGGPSKSCADKKPQKSGQSNPKVQYVQLTVDRRSKSGPPQPVGVW